jgi:two-component sensor histidine kinase
VLVPNPSNLLITDQLLTRPAHRPDLQAEIDAFRELSMVLAFEPGRGIQRFVEIALELCKAGSAGFSELHLDGTEPLFRWAALAGKFAPHIGGTMLRDASPCGLCLDHGTTILMCRPARFFEFSAPVANTITEALIVPVYDMGRVPLGTIWVMSHDERQFDATDARILEGLAIQLFLAIKARKEGDRLKQTALKAREIGHRVSNSLQMVVSLLLMQAASTGTAEAAETLKVAAARVAAIGRVHHQLDTDATGARAGCLAYLKSLGEGIAQSLIGDIATPRLEFEGEEAELPADKLVPVGLIVNELVTNAAKHGHGSRIMVRFQTARHGYAITVGDDGDGLPEGFDPRKTRGLGMKIVNSLVKEIGGSLHAGRGADGRGSEFTVTFSSLKP